MAGSTKIQWAQAVWNVTKGCSRISPGCLKCYAERDAIRMSGPGKAYEGLVRSTPNGPRWTGVVRLFEDELEVPLHWRKPRRVFTNSMSDLFHETLTFEEIDRVFEVKFRAPQHTYMDLTKRAERMAEYVRSRVARGLNFAALGNLWFGASVESQEYVKRAVAIMDLPVAVRWLSCEPLLGPLDLRAVLGPDRINWLVVGGESSAHPASARPCDSKWIRDIVQQARAAGVAVFVKQLGSNCDGRLLATHGGELEQIPADLRIRRYPAPQGRPI